MMGVYIKGMNKPSVCITEDGWFGNCPMDRTWCQQRFAPPETTMGEAYKDRLGKLPEWCPLVPVPAHGRLIDADAVTDAAMEDILGWEDAGCDRSDYRAFLDNYIKDAPTIIEAEEGE